MFTGSDARGHAGKGVGLWRNVCRDEEWGREVNDQERGERGYSNDT